MNRRRIALPALLATGLALAACGGGGSPAPTTAEPGGGVAATRGPATESTPAAAETAAPPAAAGPIDACALLTIEAVADVVPEPRAISASDESGPVATYRCTWSTSAHGKIMALTLNVMPGYVSFLVGLGGDVDAVRSEILAAANDPDKPGRVVDGLGDVAAAWLDDYYNQADVRFLKGDAQVAFEYVGDNAQDAPGKLDAIVELARAAAGRLP